MQGEHLSSVLGKLELSEQFCQAKTWGAIGNPTLVRIREKKLSSCIRECPGNSSEDIFMDTEREGEGESQSISNRD